MTRIALTVFAVAVGLSTTFAAPPVISGYPQAALSPSSPSMTDSVSLWLILGEYSNSCVPTYTSSSSIKQVSNNICVRYPCPQDFVITLTYRENPPLPLGRPCLMVITPYGPQFSFGRLDVGSYKVYDGVAKDTVTSFLVTENPVITLRDTVLVLPPNPTAKDSLTFNLYLADACCCSGIYKQSVSVSDTIIYLSYEIDNNPCMLCDCMAAGKTIVFKSKPLKAGSYAIYEAPSTYCPPNQPCPYLSIMPVRVGSVRVSGATSAEGLSMPRASVVGPQGTAASASRYDIRGRLIPAVAAKTARLTVICPRAGAPSLRVEADRR